MPVLLPAVDPLVVRTPFLSWAPALGGRLRLTTSQALLAFARRCKVSRAPADMPRFAVVILLRLGLTTAAWRRVLGELVASGLLGCTFSDVPQMHAAIDSLSLRVPANMIIHPRDLQLGQASTAAQPLPTNLVFLSLVNVADLEVAGHAPWAIVTRLAGVLGPCLTRAACNALGSHVRLAAAIISAGVRRSYSLDAGDDYGLAASLRDGVACARLPELLLPAGDDCGELRDAMRDALRYHRSASDRQAVEQGRVLFLGADHERVPTLDTYVVSRESDPPRAYSLLRRAAAALSSSFGAPLNRTPDG